MENSWSWDRNTNIPSFLMRQGFEFVPDRIVKTRGHSFVYLVHHPLCATQMFTSWKSPRFSICSRLLVRIASGWWTKDTERWAVSLHAQEVPLGSIWYTPTWNHLDTGEVISSSRFFTDPATAEQDHQPSCRYPASWWELQWSRWIPRPSWCAQHREPVGSWEPPGFLY